MKSFLLFTAVLFQVFAVSSADAATKTNALKRISHAKELLGKNYRASAVRKTEKTGNINVFITKSVRNLLPKAHNVQ